MPFGFPQPPQATLPCSCARVDEYRLLQRRLQTMRSVVVTPSAYDTDNRVTLDAIAQFDQALEASPWFDRT